MIAQVFLASFSSRLSRVDIVFGFVDIDIHWSSVKVNEGSAIIILLRVEVLGGVGNFWNGLWVNKERFIEIIISLSLLLNSRFNCLLDDLVHLGLTSSELSQVAWASSLVLLSVVLATGVLGGYDGVFWVSDISGSSLVLIGVDIRVLWIFSTVDDNIVALLSFLIPCKIRSWAIDTGHSIDSVRSSFRARWWSKWWNFFATSLSSSGPSSHTISAFFAVSLFGELLAISTGWLLACH
jgi:hypothetical protein